MSILSERPDGCGYYYGFLKPDMRQINVKKATGPHSAVWNAYVGGILVAIRGSKDEAEAAAIQYIQGNPEENDEGEV